MNAASDGPLARRAMPVRSRANATPPAPPAEEPLPPLQQPVAINYVWQGNLNQPVIQYPLSQVVIPGVVDPLLNKENAASTPPSVSIAPTWTVR